MRRGRMAPLRAAQRAAPFTLSTLIAFANAASVSVPWNTERTYGFDGPWQAVTVNVGGFLNGMTPSSQWTTVDLLPGGYFDTFVPSAALCQTNSSGFCGAGGVWDPNSNQTQDGLTTIFYEPSTSNSGGNGINQQGTVYAQNLVILSSVCSGGGNCIIPNSSLVSIQDANVTLPNGHTTDLEIGSLALGASSQTQDFTTGSNVEGQDTINTWNAPGFLYNSSVTMSDTFSLHIGSAPFKYPGSLIFGGFDQGRAIGPATSWSSSSSPQLLDIIIDVETGGSPFNDTSAKTGLLLSNTSRQEAIAVAPLPTAPYLGLPKETCDNLARYLPIQFDTASQYYLWNTADPMYTKLIQSPAYLGFTFPPAAGNTDNVLIKVPFLLLNLTLKEVASGRSGETPYFPCVPYTPGDGSNVYTLGRAFLQSAFFAGNFASGISWLAQAPGPGSTKNGLGSAPQVVDIAADASTLNFVAQANDSSFNSSWSGFWTPLQGAVQSTNATTNAPDTAVQQTASGSGGGLSSGAQAGIGVGVAVVALAAIGLAVFFFLRHRRSQKNPTEKEPFVAPPPQTYHSGYPAEGRAEEQPFQELGAQQRYEDHPYKGAYAPGDREQYAGDATISEMPARRTTQHFELPGNEPVEMDASQQHPGVAEAPTTSSRSPV